MSVNNPMAPVAKATRWPIVSVLNWLFVLVGWIELVSAVLKSYRFERSPICAPKSAVPGEDSPFGARRSRR